jgi:hypothetical protein
MATSKKLSRADVYKQIDAFRGIVKRSPGEQPSAEQWVEAKRAATAAGAGKFQPPAALARRTAV